MGIDRTRAVFLDRDGVINRAVIRDRRPHSPAGPGDLELFPDVGESLVRLRDAGYRLVVVTNQPNVARGIQSREVIDAMHQVLMRALPLDEIRVCPHDDADGCACRKPAPGLLLSAARETGLDLAGSFMIGDRWRDVEAGRQAGCRTVFIDWGYDEPRPRRPDFTASSLTEAVDWILSQPEGAGG